MMLKFYGYYKQATLGPCNEPKPSFWDVVNRAKWDAWHKLGDMAEEEAMQRYVEELKQIIETMPFSEQVSDFMENLGPFYESIQEEHESNLLADSGIELEPGNVNALLGNFDEAYVTQGGGDNVHLRTQSLENRLDKMMQEMDNVQKMMQLSTMEQDLGQWSDEEDEYEDPSGDIESSSTTHHQQQEIQKTTMSEDKVGQALKSAVLQLNCDMDHMKARVSSLEALVAAQNAEARTSFLSELSGPTTAFVIVWPFVAFALLKMCK